jgi:hypothetical protein
VNVEITVRIDGQEVATLKHAVCGEAIELERQTEKLKDRVGQVVLETGFEELAASLRRPCCCGKPMENRGRRRVTIMSLSGEVTFERTRYRCRTCRCYLTPADAVVRCGHHRMTRHLAKQVCQLATLEHFTQLERLMSDQHGVDLGHDEMLQLVHDVGGTVDAQRQAQAKFAAAHPSTISPEVRPSRVYVSCDGIMYCTNEREPCPENPAKNRLIWRQMRVGCVSWQDEHERWHKRVIWGQEDLQTFAASLYRLACQCGYREAREKIFAADGGDWCWGIQDKYFADATGILDWYHASEHVWDCAKILFSDELEIREWVDEALGLLRYHGGEGLVTWLRPQLSGLRGKKRKAVNSLLGYFRSRLGLTDYPEYHRHGWQIGTGMIESTARQLVGLRLKGPGMHWSPPGASAITALRAHNINHNWHNLWKNLTIA